MWRDLQLKTAFADVESKDALKRQSWSYLGKPFSLNNTLFCVLIQAHVQANRIEDLITIDQNDTIIDRLEVYSTAKSELFMNPASGMQYPLSYYLRQFKIEVDSTITVYQVISIEKGSTDTFSKGLYSFLGQRTDTKYCLTAQWKFKAIKTIKYIPETHTIQYLADYNAQIWDGADKLHNTQKSPVQKE